jgi:DNA-binding response OmpR family regulator
MDLDEFFTGAVRGLITDLQGSLDTWRRTGDASELRRHCHSIKGSGGSFGFPLISVLAAAAEDAPPDQLERATALLAAELETVATTPTQKNVLVIDDDPLIANLLQRRLSGPERHVTVAPDITTARRELAGARFDLIILDLLLPDGDGRSLLDEMGGGRTNAGVPVVVLSASDAAGLHADCLTRGADAFVTKPFDPDAFVHLAATVVADTNDDANLRSAFVAAFERMRAAGSALTVCSILAETHGPGGRTWDVPDPTALDPVEHAVRGALTGDAVTVRWGRAELAVLTPTPVAQTVHELDRARLRLRTTPHPSVEGALPSFSAGIVDDDDPEHGLISYVAHARRLARAAHERGGDRVAADDVAGGASRILLAEDDTLTAALVVHRLEREGFIVDHHGNGTSAAEAFARSPFDLVVLDVQMPGLDGFEVLNHIRRDAKSTVPVVMLTAVGNEKDVVRGFELGADDYILKPFSPAELTMRLKRFTHSK